MNKKIACTFIISPQKMQETKDSSIKLFGRNISLQAEGHCPVIDAEKGGGGGEDEGRQRKGQDVEADKESQNGKVKESPEEKEAEETAKHSKNKDGTNSQEKILKKPEQVLPCPRCDSNNTKFCYYNNYNINQPRHFCKSCQRYWTKGGTMRNVPVGSGRRKTKNHSSHYPYITINEALRVAKFSAPNNGTNGKVLNFESDSYMGSVLNLSENKIVSKSTKYPCSIEEIKKNTLQFPCVTWSSNIPMFPSKMSSPNLNYPILGKNGRDGDMVEVCRQRNGSVLVPKTLRIDDPSEVAMSSIWKTLGLENGSLKSGSMFEAFQSCKGGKNQKHQRDETCSVFMANPAALSRSFHFHENT